MAAVLPWSQGRPSQAEDALGPGSRVAVDGEERPEIGMAAAVLVVQHILAVLLGHGQQVTMRSPDIALDVRQRQRVRHLERGSGARAAVAQRLAHDNGGDRLEVVHLAEHAMHDHGPQVWAIAMLGAG